MLADEPITQNWLRQVCQHDEEAARLLVERLYPIVFRIVTAHRPRQMAEEDLCQEVFMSVFANLEQYGGKVPFEHWVSRIAVNTCIDQLRRQRARPELRYADLSEEEVLCLESTLADQAESSPEQSAATRELVDKLLDDLDPSDRLLIKWLELEDRTVKEVAELTGWSQALVKVRAFRARHRMRKTLERILKQENL
jgi:RNA polymerase sigma-70 factor (ECF subfamily)